MRKILFVIVAILVSSCCGIPQKAKLPLPPEPTYHKITDNELACLTDATYAKLAENDLACKQSLKTHRDIIKVTHD